MVSEPLGGAMAPLAPLESALSELAIKVVFRTVSEVKEI